MNDLGLDLLNDPSLVEQRKDAWVGVCDSDSAVRWQVGVRTCQNVDRSGAEWSEDVDVETEGTWTVGVWEIVVGRGGADVGRGGAVVGHEGAVVGHEGVGLEALALDMFPTTVVCFGASLWLSTHRHESLAWQCRVRRCGTCP